jgi:hypothetical protein
MSEKILPHNQLTLRICSPQAPSFERAKAGETVFPI